MGACSDVWNVVQQAEQERAAAEERSRKAAHEEEERKRKAAKQQAGFLALSLTSQAWAHEQRLHMPTCDLS